jgi:isoamylase
MNSHWDALPFELPTLPGGRRWHVAVNTSAPTGEDIWPVGSEAALDNQRSFLVGGRSVVVLVGK